MSSVLLKSDLVVALDREDRILQEGYLVIEDDRITEMGLQKDLRDNRKFDDIVELKNRLVMPGLINAHTHTPMTLFRGHVEVTASSRWMAGTTRSAFWNCRWNLRCSREPWQSRVPR